MSISKGDGGGASLPFLLLVALVLMLAGCFAPRHKWYYRVTVDANPIVTMGNYTIELELVDYNWDKGREPKETYSVAAGFDTYYSGVISEPGSTDHVPLIRVDSLCVNMPISQQLQCRTTKVSGDTARMTWLNNRWNGPQYGASVEIPFADSIITVSFVVILSHRLSGAELQRQEYSLDLQRFHERYWILAQ